MNISEKLTHAVINHPDILTNYPEFAIQLLDGSLIVQLDIFGTYVIMTRSVKEVTLRIGNKSIFMMHFAIENNDYLLNALIEDPIDMNGHTLCRITLS